MYQRETFHLAVDYLDRYFARSTNVSRSEQQRIAAAALLIAVKMNERRRLSHVIYRLAESTDGNSTENDIRQQEIAMLRVRTVAK